MASERPVEHRISRGQLVAAATVAALLLGLARLPLKGLAQSADEAPGFDAHIYVAMAEAPAVFTMPPFGYRVLVPALAHALPLALEDAFYLLSVLGLLLTSVVGYVFFRCFGYSHSIALIGLVFLGAAPQVRLYLSNYFLVDPLALALMTAVLVSIEREANGRTAFLLLIASLAKESAFFVLPVLYLTLSRSRWVDGAALRKALLIALPAVAAALLLRFAWSGGFAWFPYRPPPALMRESWYGDFGSWERLWRYLFGYLAILAAANAASAGLRSFAIRYSPYLALTLAQLLVATDAQRLLYFGFPVVIPLALAEFDRISRRLPEWYPLLATLLVFSYLFLPKSLAVPLGIVGLSRLLMSRREAARS